MNLSRSKRRKMIRAIKNTDVYSEFLKVEREKYKLSCFSEKYNEVLMWSHYANKHQGICIGFNFPIKYEEKFMLCHVKYLDKILPIDGKADLLRVILYWLTTKSIRWNYENEIRAISVNSKEIIEFDKIFVKEIIFGCKVSNHKIRHLLTEIKNFGYNLTNIRLKKMEIDKESFLLKEKTILPNL